MVSLSEYWHKNIYNYKNKFLFLVWYIYFPKSLKYKGKRSGKTYVLPVFIQTVGHIRNIVPIQTGCVTKKHKRNKIIIHNRTIFRPLYFFTPTEIYIFLVKILKRILSQATSCPVYPFQFPHEEIWLQGVLYVIKSKFSLQKNIVSADTVFCELNTFVYWQKQQALYPLFYIFFAVNIQ